MMKILSALFFSASLFLVSPVVEAENGSGGCVSPTPNRHVYWYGILTDAAAVGLCALTLPASLEEYGYQSWWRWGAPAPGEEAYFECFVCTGRILGNPAQDWCPNSGSSDPWCDSANHTPFSIDQAIWIALDAYPGVVSAVEYFIVEDEVEGLGASYEVTIVNPHEGRSAVLRVDPFTGQAIVLQEAATANR